MSNEYEHFYKYGDREAVLEKFNHCYKNYESFDL